MAVPTWLNIVRQPLSNLLLLLYLLAFAQALSYGRSNHSLRPRGNDTLPSLANTKSYPAPYPLPVVLTIFQLAKSRYVDPMTGQDVIPYKMMLTFTGNETHMATQFLVDECDGTPCLLARRFWINWPIFRSEYTTVSSQEIFINYSGNATGSSTTSQPIQGTGNPSSRRVRPRSTDSYSDGSYTSDQMDVFAAMQHVAEEDAETPIANLEDNIFAQAAAMEPADGSGFSDAHFNDAIGRNADLGGGLGVHDSLQKAMKKAAFREKLNLALAQSDPYVKDHPLTGSGQAPGSKDGQKKVRFLKELSVREYALSKDELSQKLAAVDKIDARVNVNRILAATEGRMVEDSESEKTVSLFESQTPLKSLKSQSFGNLGEQSEFSVVQEAVNAQPPPRPISPLASVPAEDSAIESTSNVINHNYGAPLSEPNVLAFEDVAAVDAAPSIRAGADLDDGGSFLNEYTDSVGTLKGETSAPHVKAPSPDIGEITDLAYASVGGELKLATLVASNALAALNVAGIIAGAAFIIVDFVNGNLVGGILGIVGTVTALATGVAFEVAATEFGPVGWIIAGVITALFSIFPGLFNPGPQPPGVDDNQGILQWSFFGDKDHTGNEKCRQDTPTVKANPECQAVFGPSMLAHILKITVFDAVMLLIYFNRGYYMSIEDLATSFTVINPKHRQDYASFVATIDCHNSRPAEENSENPNITPACPNPTYSINRDAITIPVINQTASQIFKRVSGPNPDCRLVSYPEGQTFPEYGNLTIKGLPCAVACGIQPGLNISGTLVNLDGNPVQNGSLVSSGQNASDGVGGAHIAPPPATGLYPWNQTQCVCLSDSLKNTECLLSGQYQVVPKVNFGSIDASKISSVSIASNASLRIAYTYEDRSADSPGFTNEDTTYTSAKPAKDNLQNIQNDLAFLIPYNNPKEHQITVTCAPSPPTIGFCLYAQKGYNGQFICFGAGGGNLPPEWQNKVQSIHVVFGTRLEIFQNSYGDVTGTPLSQDEPDLSALSPGDKDFSQKLAAVWAYS